MGVRRNLPVSVQKSDDSFAILIGYALDEDGRWLTAKDLAERWHDKTSTAGVFDGYHLGIVYDATKGLVAGVDPFGMFPLYFATLAGGDEGAVVVTSTPEAVSPIPDIAHPSTAWAWQAYSLATACLTTVRCLPV